MIIALDARTVFTRGRRGTGKNLIDLYRGIAASRPEWRVVMFHRGQGEDDPFADVANIENRRIDMPGDRFSLWQQLRLPLAARGVRADLLHAPANTGPRRPMTPMVVTIHDLIPLDPALGYTHAAAWGKAVGATARAAQRIMTPSEFSRRQIIDTFRISADKVVVNHWAADRGCAKVTDAGRLDNVRARYGLARGRPFVFGFAASDPRKNTDRILAAWSRIPGDVRGDFALVLVGIQSEALPLFQKTVDELELSGQVYLHGFAAEEDIPALLSAADVLCYPSLSEGFGLPVLDAFACDAVVLTSDCTSLPEVTGEAGIVVDPRDVEAIASGLGRLLSDESLRSELARRGRKRLGEFTWEACVGRACRIFEDACG